MCGLLIKKIQENFLLIDKTIKISIIVFGVLA